MGKNKDEGIIEKTRDNGVVINPSNVMSINEIMRTFRCLSVIGITIAISVMVLSLVVGAILTYTCVTTDRDQVVGNQKVISHLAIMNNYSESEIIEVMDEYESMRGFAFSYAVVPTLVAFTLMISILAISINIHRFVKDVEVEDELFTKEKLKKLKKIRTYLLVIGLLVIIFFNLLHILIYAVFEVIFEFILYMFNKCVKAN